MLFSEGAKRGIAALLQCTAILSLALFAGCGGGGGGGGSEPEPETKWTIMYYGDADNNLELDLLIDVQEMKAGFVDGQGVNLIVLFDRIDGESSDSSVFGQNFTDTRLYRITRGNAWRLSGGDEFPEITTGSSYEANMGDAETLRKFITFCKANYPAEKYALILSNHGGGPKKKKASSAKSLSPDLKSQTKDICWDDTTYILTHSTDFLYTAEISDTLTSAESVDLLGLDACLMSSVEFAYQFRNDSSNTGFKAGIMVACPPTETGYGWAYDAIFGRLKSGGGNNGTADTTLGGYELYYDPETLTAQDLGAIIVEEQRDSTAGDSSQALTCLDLSKVTAVKDAVDAMAVALATDSEKDDLETLRGNAPTASLLHYFGETDINEWAYYLFFDLYNLAAAINGSANFSVTVRGDAAAVRDAVDAFVLCSFANSDFSGFTEGKSGVHIFFPDGDCLVSADIDNNGTDENVNLWYWQDWYNAIDISGEYTDAPLGSLAWCSGGATASNGTVENWFELLDCWFDTQTIGTLSNFNYYSY